MQTQRNIHSLIRLKKNTKRSRNASSDSQTQSTMIKLQTVWHVPWQKKNKGPSLQNTQSHTKKKKKQFTNFKSEFYSNSPQ